MNTTVVFSLALLVVMLLAVASAQVSIVPDNGGEDVSKRLEDIESKIEGLRSAPPPAATESQAVDDAAALHEMKESDKDDREDSEDEHEEHSEEEEEDSEKKEEGKKEDKLASNDREGEVNVEQANEEAVSDQTKTEKSQELEQTKHDVDKEKGLRAEDESSKYT
eukprot:GHVS01105826.1.p1 GENE.GHVS01105826.1~~GHVS01105826.1.p1  ORF type:complete len:165 (+),score=45.01 GHVS01105826.1:348-842(+)